MNTKAKKNIEHLRALAKKHRCLKEVSPVLDNPEFAIWTGSPGNALHHFGKGGLLQHTREVTDLCLAMAGAIEGGETIDRKILVTSAIWHDHGKLKDYRPTNKKLTKWESTDEKYRVYHIVNSAMEFEKLFGRKTKFAREVFHCILAHHGRFEWKSPVVPQTREALLLHMADNVSARCQEKSRNRRRK